MTEELKEIKKVYHIINDRLISANSYVDQITRNMVITRLISMLEDKLYNARVICDESNNPPSVVDDNIIIARVEWTLNKFDSRRNYVDLYFGVSDVTWEVNKQLK